MDLLFADTTLETDPPAAKTSSSDLVAVDSSQIDSDARSLSNDEPLSLERLLDRATVDEPMTVSEPIKAISSSSNRASNTNPTPKPSDYATRSRSESAPSQKERKSANVRVEIEQLERLNHTVRNIVYKY